jgi:hypothetical protein
MMAQVKDNKGIYQGDQARPISGQSNAKAIVPHCGKSI